MLKRLINLIFVALFLAPFASNSQILTSAQIFGGIQGAIIEIEYIRTGELKTNFDIVRFDVMKYKDLANNTTKVGLRLSSNDLYNFVDSDELENIIKSLKSMNDIVTKTKSKWLVFRCFLLCK